MMHDDDVTKDKKQMGANAALFFKLILIRLHLLIRINFIDPKLGNKAERLWCDSFSRPTVCEAFGPAAHLAPTTLKVLGLLSAPVWCLCQTSLSHLGHYGELIVSWIETCCSGPVICTLMSQTTRNLSRWRHSKWNTNWTEPKCKTTQSNSGNHLGWSYWILCCPSYHTDHQPASVTEVHVLTHVSLPGQFSYMRLFSSNMDFVHPHSTSP